MFGWKKKVKEAAAKGDGSLAAVLDALPEEMEEGSATHVHVHTGDGKTKDAHEAGCTCKECKEKDTKTNDGFTKDAVLDAVFNDKRFTDLSADVKRIADAFGKEESEEEEEEEEEKKKKKAEDEENREIEGSLEMEAPPGTSDGVAGKARDSAYLADSFQEAVSLAEIIAPGIAIPTFDAKAAPKATYDALCQFRRRVIDTADRDPVTHAFIDNITGGRDVKKYTCDGVRTLFRALGAHKRKANNDAVTVDTPTRSGGGTGSVSAALRTPADINRRNSELYKSNT